VHLLKTGVKKPTPARSQYNVSFQSGAIFASYLD
jgi:hypothetical protein